MPSRVPARRPSAAAPPIRCSTVADVMHPGIVGCSARTTLRDAAELMLDRRVHAIIVDGPRAQDARRPAPCHLITDRDVAGAIGRDADRVTVGDLAACDAVTVAPEASLAHAARLMRERGVGHLLVVRPQSGLPAGVVSALDLVRAVAWGARRATP